MKLFITGATRGIGRAIADRLAPKCDSMFLVARDTDALTALSAELREMGCSDVQMCAADLADRQAADLIHEAAVRASFSPNVLVLNAGTFLEGTLVESHSQDFRETLEVNLTSSYELVKRFVPGMVDARRPRIVLIGSTAALEAYPVGALYGVAKWGLRGYAVNLRSELMREGIGVTFVAPGGTLTDLWEGEELEPNRLLEPDDVAAVVEMSLTLSDQAVVEEVIVRPMLGDLHE